MTGSPAPARSVSEGDFPELFRVADANSQAAQRRFFAATRLQLGGLVAAAGFGVFAWNVADTDIAGLLAAIAFGTALTAETYLFRERPNVVWYDGRAAAESAKTLTWRYLVGGDPLGVDDTPRSSAQNLFVDRLREIARAFEPMALVPVTVHGDGGDDGGGGGHVHTLRRFRELPLDERRRLYIQERIVPQRRWYTVKADRNWRLARRWSLALATVQLLGLCGGLLKAVGILDVDLLGLAGALGAAGVAWVQAKQHQNLAAAYTVARHELSLIEERADDHVSEREWASFVASAEDAISREHTMWGASRR